MKKALIIGGGGFVGGHLLAYLKSRGDHVSVTKMPHELFSADADAVYDLDILKEEDVFSLLDRVRPDAVYHLAAQSSVALSWKNPGLTVDVNVKGTLNLLNAVLRLRYAPRLLLVGSGEEYGRISEEEVPVTEKNALRPGNVYAATKVCQNMLGKIYADAYGMDIVMVRAFNHIGPGQSDQFVISNFCKQVAEIEREDSLHTMQVGNLKARRDFTDVRDVVRAYGMLMESGSAGETYNVGSGKAVSIEEILKTILSISTREIGIETDPERFRPIDLPVVQADIGKLKGCTGWVPEIPLSQSIKETLEYWRERGRDNVDRQG